MFLRYCLFKIDVVFVNTENIMQKYFHVKSNLRLTHFEYCHKKLFMLKEIEYIKQFKMYLQVHSASQP